MKVLVCGSRYFEDRRVLGRALSALHAETPITLIIQGGATGADHLAKLWAHHQKVSVCEFPANWKFHGKAAGPIRNQSMLDIMAPDLVVAFLGGAGTADMVRRSEAAGVRVLHPQNPPAASPQNPK